MTIRLPLVFAILLLVSPIAIAGELKLSGEFSQGGLIVGWATPGASITLDGNRISQARSGEFLLGFARRADRMSQLNVIFADGSTAQRKLTIKQRKYDIQRIDGLPKRKVTPSAEDLARIKNERTLIDRARKTKVAEPLFAAGFGRPVNGRISGVYGSQRILNGQKRRPHYGQDIAAAQGTKIKAASAGVVIFAHPGMFFNGKTVIINHGLGLLSTYIHMNTVEVKVGEHVAKGQTIGEVGQTGRATGPHLHWGLTLNKTPLDPALIIN